MPDGNDAVRVEREQGRCASCRWWQHTPDAFDDPDYATAEGHLVVRDPVTYEMVDPQPFDVRRCYSPKVRFFERPEQDGAAILDGSQYMGMLCTGPDFGCIHWEAASLSDPTREAP